jgi:hypothetical protein
VQTSLLHSWEECVDEGDLYDAKYMKIMIVYDDVDAGKRAKEFCDRIVRSLGPEMKLSLGVWKASMFRLPEINRVATHAATQAVAMIFALAGCKELSPELKDWIERLKRNDPLDRDCALVVLLHDIQRAGMDSAPACVSLSRYAQSVGMEFFADVIEPRQDECDYSIEGIHQRASRHTTVLDRMLPHHQNRNRDKGL